MLLSLLETILITYMMEKDLASQEKLRLKEDKEAKEENVEADTFNTGETHTSVYSYKFLLNPFANVSNLLCSGEKRQTCCSFISQVSDGEKQHEPLPLVEEVKEQTYHSIFLLLSSTLMLHSLLKPLVKLFIFCLRWPGELSTLNLKKTIIDFPTTQFCWPESGVCRLTEASSRESLICWCWFWRSWSSWNKLWSSTSAAMLRIGGARHGPQESTEVSWFSTSPLCRCFCLSSSTNGTVRNEHQTMSVSYCGFYIVNHLCPKCDLLTNRVFEYGPVGENKPLKRVKTCF